MTAQATRQTASDRPALGLRRIAIVILALVGMFVSSYLIYTHYSGQNIQCFGVGGCDLVSASRWGSIDIPTGGAAPLSIPISIPGLGLYITLLALALVPRGRWYARAGQALFALAFAGVVYSAYLTYIELFVLYKICPWCVASAAAVTGIWLLAWPRAGDAADAAGGDDVEDDAVDGATGD